MDLDVYVRRAGSLGYIRETKGPEAQSFIDKQVQLWYTQSFSGSWSGTYKPGLVKIETSYLTWFGSNENGLRSRISVLIL
ncbi:hypothetical protein Naga_100088g1 [Nannochloropsis gaditana]|uniref:Uncharacterized protein n=1 Tax=Nannochloropsis gaditana TaxID=72520 RepID=W7U6J0_9STRA|nr:hypothetical protein Naga_100088g1 [Nannochloropsis gaditana]